MAIYRVPVKRAIVLTGATCKRSSLYQRLDLFRSRQQEEFGLVADNDASASDDGSGGVGIEGGDLTPPPPLVLPTKGGGRMSAAMLSSGLEDLPSWIDPERCQHSLTRRKRKSLTEAHSYRLTEQVSNLYHAGRYKNAFKACTALLKPSTEDEEGTKGTVSIQNAVDQINMQLLHSPNDKKLKKTTVYNAIARGSFGVSPLKNGRPRKVPPELTRGLACHAVMMQSSGEGEASSLKMRAIAGALTLGTQFENKFSTDYLWQRTRIEHPKMLYPAKAIDNEDRCVDWLTYKNINDWNKRAKKILIDIGMCTPERGLIRKSLVCLIIVGPSYSPVCYFITMFLLQTRLRARWVLSTRTMSIGF